MYRRARQFYRELRPRADAIAWADRPLMLQLLRSSASIALNIAEGAGEFSPGDKARFYRIAGRSACESECALELIEEARGFQLDEVQRMQQELGEISAILTTLALRYRR
ncbi:MAG TPA: four helix bundle protein [Longimicrobiales bacterium]|nr:four helix bundle protein [Longimicrobiales bacterium]